MLILDGYDELSSHLQTSSIFADIIKGKELPKMTVLVSSRPSANQNLHELCQSQKCRFIEVIGFDKGLMYVPLNCAIIVPIFREQMKNKSQPPQTHTEVYQLLIKTVLSVMRRS